jgi:hypothetical protein
MNRSNTLPGWHRVTGSEAYAMRPEACDYCGFPDPWDDDDGSPDAKGFLYHYAHDLVACGAGCARKLAPRVREGGA